MLRAKSLCQDFFLYIVLFLQQENCTGKGEADWTSKDHLKEFLFFHRRIQKGNIKAEVKKLMLFCINCDSVWKNYFLHAYIWWEQIKMAWMNSFFFFFQSFPHLDWVIWMLFISAYLLLCEWEDTYFLWSDTEKICMWNIDMDQKWCSFLNLPPNICYISQWKNR